MASHWLAKIIDYGLLDSSPDMKEEASVSLIHLFLFCFFLLKKLAFGEGNK
jgi:hypothetical protein